MIRNFLVGEMVEIYHKDSGANAQILDIKGDIYIVKIETEEGDGERIKILENAIIGYPGGRL